MTSCSGPYTRVFLDKRDAAECRTLAETLSDSGHAIDRATLPKGAGLLDDFTCDLFFRHPETATTAWVVRLAKYLGPRKLLRQTHVYEITVQKTEPDTDQPWQGHLFGSSLEEVRERFVNVLPRLARSEKVEGVVPHAEAHETRIELCNDL